MITAAERMKVLRETLEALIGTVKTSVYAAGDPEVIDERAGVLFARWRAGERAVEVSVRAMANGAVIPVWSREDLSKRLRFTCSDSDGALHVRWMLFG